jgi:hypothetical protein
MTAPFHLRAGVLALVLPVGFLGLWELAGQAANESESQAEHELLMGGVDQAVRMPPPSQVMEPADMGLANRFCDAARKDSNSKWLFLDFRGMAA